GCATLDSRALCHGKPQARIPLGVLSCRIEAAEERERNRIRRERQEVRIRTHEALNESRLLLERAELVLTSAVVGADRISRAVLRVRLDRGTSLPVARQLRERGIPFVFLTGQPNTDQTLAEWQDAKIISKHFHRRTVLVAVADMLETDKQRR
ncbi:MAG TPA: hypothetical protein VMF32_17275, partial [Xanthobacteraceae bacterium]|nr:hypothetical protein [Xanthobacteraceae bacterium]